MACAAPMRLRLIEGNAAHPNPLGQYLWEAGLIVNIVAKCACEE